jgi:2-methylcitrate dehydratase
MAGRLWGLKREAIAQAVGISAARGYTSFVINSGAISMMKAMGLAGLATDGIFATRLAAQGFTGPQDTLDWVVAKMKPAISSLPVDLAPERPRLPRVAFKRFPIQIELAAPAEAGALLSARVKGRVPDIREIVVQTYPGIIERVADAPKFDPKTKGTADHSLPVCLAMALLDGDVTVAQFEKDRWRDRDVMGLVQRTKVVPSEALMAKLPKGRGAIVDILFTDGTSLRETVEVPEGDPSRPLSRASLERKFTAFATPVLGADGAKRVLGMVDGLEDVKDVKLVMQALTATV